MISSVLDMQYSDTDNEDLRDNSNLDNGDPSVQDFDFSDVFSFGIDSEASTSSARLKRNSSDSKPTKKSVLAEDMDRSDFSFSHRTGNHTGTATLKVIRAKSGTMKQYLVRTKTGAK